MDHRHPGDGDQSAYDHLVSVVVADTKAARFLDTEDQIQDLFDVGDDDGLEWKDRKDSDLSVGPQ